MNDHAEEPFLESPQPTASMLDARGYGRNVDSAYLSHARRCFQWDREFGA
jgi:hypothetical protein